MFKQENTMAIDKRDPRASTSSRTLGDQAYQKLRDMIVTLEFLPGDVLHEHELRASLGIGRTPIREALKRLEREHFVSVIPRRGVYVSGIDVSELSLLFETRAVLEPYAARLAAVRGRERDWQAMAEVLAQTHEPGLSVTTLLKLDRKCHEIMWIASGNRFLLDTLDMLYAQSDRLWHLYLADVAQPGHAVAEHFAILEALRQSEPDRAASLVASHVALFDEQVRAAVTNRLDAPLAG